VGTLEVGEDDLAVVELDLGVEAADALVVEPQDVALLPANGDGGGQLAEDAALVDSFEHLKGYRRHRMILRDVRPSRAGRRHCSCPSGRWGPFGGPAPARPEMAGVGTTPHAGLIA